MQIKQTPFIQRTSPSIKLYTLSLQRSFEPDEILDLMEANKMNTTESSSEAISSKFPESKFQKRKT